jgi:hypothetical protein
MSGPILDDIHAEAVRIVQAGDAQGITLRLLGGLAIRARSPSATHRALARSYPDIDLATPERRAGPVEKLIAGLGYEPSRQFNLLNGESRLLFHDDAHARQVDVFIAQFRMCHQLPITERIASEPLTLPLAELLLTKLQIVQMNEKDIRDICALLLDHPFGAQDGEIINLSRIAQLCANDWGLWKTVTLSVQKTRAYCEADGMDAALRGAIVPQLDSLSRALDETPKPLKWKVRARVGEKMTWYELPEEVRRS